MSGTKGKSDMKYEALSAYDKQLLFEEALEKLRIEYKVTSQKISVSRQAKRLIDSYYGATKAADRAFAIWKLPSASYCFSSFTLAKYLSVRCAGSPSLPMWYRSKRSIEAI